MTDLLRSTVALAVLVLAGCGAPIDEPDPDPEPTPEPPLACDDITSEYVDNEAPDAPPWSGTIFTSPAILTEDDPTTYGGRVYDGVGTRTTYDRREAAWVETEVHLFTATFDDQEVEVRVNTEFTLEEAEEHGDTYLPAIGRLPPLLLVDVDTVTIHGGDEPFGGGNRDLLIHTLQGDRYIADGILEETFAHEAAHTSLDGHHAATPEWIAAQEADGGFISDYAEEWPQREDVAESVVPYLAYRLRPEAYAGFELTAVADAIPNRVTYFDCLDLSFPATVSGDE